VKAQIREILTDIKAALRIGDPDALYAVLQQIRSLDESQLPTAALLDLGQPLFQLPLPELQSLSNDASPVVRSMAAAGLARKAGRSAQMPTDDLDRLAADRSPEVRQILVQALEQGDVRPDELSGFAKRWLAGDEPFQVACGLALLPATSPEADQIAALLFAHASSPDYALRSALVDCLNGLAQTGQADAVLGLLSAWSEQEDPNVWVITRALSASWAQNHSPAAISILQKLSETAGALRAIQRASERHRSP
jgi:hypothetical protein